MTEPTLFDMGADTADAPNPRGADHQWVLDSMERSGDYFSQQLGSLWREASAETSPAMHQALYRRFGELWQTHNGERSAYRHVVLICGCNVWKIDVCLPTGCNMRAGEFIAFDDEDRSKVVLEVARQVPYVPRAAQDECWDINELIDDITLLGELRRAVLDTLEWHELLQQHEDARWRPYPLHVLQGATTETCQELVLAVEETYDATAAEAQAAELAEMLKEIDE